MTKPSSKVIQIAPSGHQNGRLAILCEDGSVWETCLESWGANYKWVCILEPHQPAQPSIPVPGSRWVRKSDQFEITIKEVTSNVKGCHVDWGASYGIDLQDFLERYEPKPFWL